MDGILTSAPLLAHNNRRKIYAHLCSVQGVQDVTQALLKIQIDPVFAEASALPCAYRIRLNETAETLEEYDDSGELFAGRSLLDLLRYWEVENVLLVTSCFDNDSGFTLRASSSERSRFILACAKRLLEMCIPPDIRAVSEPPHTIKTVEIDLAQIRPENSVRRRKHAAIRGWKAETRMKEEEAPDLVTKLCNLLPEDFATLKILSRTDALARRMYNLSVSLEGVLQTDKTNQLRLRGEYDKKMMFLVHELAKSKHKPLLQEIKSTLDEESRLPRYKSRVLTSFFKWLGRLCNTVEQVQREPKRLEFSVRAKKLSIEPNSKLQSNFPSAKP